MNQSAGESQRTDPELLRTLASQYLEYHRSVENYVLLFFAELGLLRRLGIEPERWPGRLMGGIFQFLVILLPALILTAITGQWADAPLPNWTIVAVAWGGISMAAFSLYRFAIGNLLAWLGVIADEAGLRRLMAWQCRWYSHRVFVPVSAALTLGVVLPLFSVLHASGTEVTAGTLYIGVFLLFLAMQNACSLVTAVFEIQQLSTCRCALYRLSPADTVAVRQSLRGYNQLGAFNVMIMTLLMLLFLVLLPGGSSLVIPVVVFLLLMELVLTAVGSQVPRAILGHIVRSRKEEEMAVLQGWIDDLLPQMRELTAEEYEEMKRLRDTQDTIRNSPENLHPLGDILRTASTVLLSALTVVLAAFAKEWIAGLAENYPR